MRKGISPIVAVVLLIAIAVIAAVGLYFWVGGLATKQPTPTTPGTITAICTGGTLTVTNIGANTISDPMVVTGIAATTGEPASGGCDANPTTSGETIVCATGVSSGTGTVYGVSTGAAQYSC